MLNSSEAKKALMNTVSSIRKIEDYVRYRNSYLFRVEFVTEDEEKYDPFFSVDINTGEVRDFSIIDDGDILEITALFLDADRNES